MFLDQTQDSVIQGWEQLSFNLVVASTTKTHHCDCHAAGDLAVLQTAFLMYLVALLKRVKVWNTEQTSSVGHIDQFKSILW